jgi:Zn-dependent M28 family amino/carboxypeptidase
MKAPAMPPQITLAAEDYNRLVRMLQQGVPLKMEVDLKVKYHYEDPMAYNTIAEIPGTDLKDQIVMLGGHMDSWQGGTGATDNGVGVAVAMEAVRIIEAAHLQPRRTIRVALWTGEEEGLLGSKAYVSNHFGSFGTNVFPRPRFGFNDAPSATGAQATTNDASTNEPPPPPLLRGPEYDNLSVYFNLDNGAGKIRGIYMQGNEAVRPIFAKWLAPFHDQGAETLTVSRTGSTDHISFDTIGLPGFQFIQDPLEYSTRTHHSNQDVFDRIQADDLKQAATVMAAFVYNAAMIDEKIPRKPATD